MIAYAIQIHGLVQGVGFRPFVYGLAARLGLRGSVRNDSGSVTVTVEGDDEALDFFLRELTSNPPPLARIGQIRCERVEPRYLKHFEIAASQSDCSAEFFVSPDIGICERCLEELFDPESRRYGYAFVSCTDCGPRLTTLESMPCDRANTAWRSLPMCEQCQSEYEHPEDRRFHDQSISCPKCGPQLSVVGCGETSIDSGADPLEWAIAALGAGRIGAVKGVGGFHLVCDAGDESTVAELRRRKKRDQKPFAVMFENLAAGRQVCQMTAAEAAQLTSSERPIVLLKKRTALHGVASSIAPGNASLGVMLPYTGLHHLLVRRFGRALVMTSGNFSDEPIAYQTKDAIRRLGSLADFILTHNRPIQIRCDDSVIRVAADKPIFVRRSRGFAPRPVRLPVPCKRPILAMGGQLKATFALGRGEHAILSHHLGDLDSYSSYREYVLAVEHYERLFSFRAELFVHDLHPDYNSTRRALELSADKARMAVQHHHAHMASCMAEHGIHSPVIGVTFDGTGFGPDHTVWGGEFLVGDLREYQRAAHLRCVPMPGAEQAIREPWRMAVSYLRDAGQDAEVVSRRQRGESVLLIEQMMTKKINSPLTSSCGRLLDAIASILGLRDRTEFEGQAAMDLESLATQADGEESYPFDLGAGAPVQIDTRPLIGAVVRDHTDRVAPSRIARRVLFSVAEIIFHTCRRLREKEGIKAVALSGGVFMNALVVERVIERLRSDGFEVFSHSQVPPNDGGLCLGQLAIAAAKETSA